MLSDRDERNQVGGCDRLVRIVTFSGNGVSNRPPDLTPRAPSDNRPNDPTKRRGGAGDGDCEGCVKVIVPGRSENVDTPGQIFLKFAIK